MSIQVIGLLIALALVLVIWFAFVAPSERQYHERKLKLLQERIERREQGEGAEDDAGADRAASE